MRVSAPQSCSRHSSSTASSLARSRTASNALVPLDRRRFYSLPGGAPTSDHIERAARRELIELAGDDIVLELTQQLIDQTPALLDLAPSLGCACAGAGEHAARGNARAALLTLEPPHARQRVLDPSVQVDVSQTLVEACALQSSAAEEPAELVVHLAADAAPAPEGVIEIVDAPAMRETMLFEAIADDDAEIALTETPVARSRVADVECATTGVVDAPQAAPLPRRRPVPVRAPAPLPRYASESGETVPRASLAMLRRALARIATRQARRQPKVERGRRDRSMELREGLVRTPARTPRSLAIPSRGGSPPPRPAPSGAGAPLATHRARVGTLDRAVCHFGKSLVTPTHEGAGRLALSATMAIFVRHGLCFFP